MLSKINAVKGLTKNYYFSSFFWSTFQKVLAAIIGFVSTPLLLGYYGKAEFGVLSIATACNGYMHLLDLGMNTGAVKFFSQWKTEEKHSLIERVARTNISFYGIIAILNIVGLVALAFLGKNLFSVSDEEYVLLRSCLLIIAAFNLFSWATTTFNQLLIANMQMAYTMKVQSAITVLKAFLIAAVFLFDLTITQYFFFLTFLVTLHLVPYIIECKRLKLINNLAPAFYWSDFKVVFIFSLSIFALSLFQTTATQSRPIILSIFAEDGAKTVADFKIIEVIPSFIIMVCGTFSGIFLPKTSALIAKGNQEEISRFAYKWTTFTTIIANCLCFPCIIGSENILTAYVGSEFSYLSIWMVIWSASILLQVHSTPLNALVLATGKTKIMVYVSATACVISVIINSLLVKYYNVGSAVIGYFVYIIINLVCLYGFYYKNVLHISSKTIVLSFLKPSLLGLISLGIVFFALKNVYFQCGGERFTEIIMLCLKSLAWLAIYSIMLLVTHTITFKGKKVITQYD